MRGSDCAEPRASERNAASARPGPDLSLTLTFGVVSRFISADRDLEGHMYGHERSGGGKGKQ